MASVTDVNDPQDVEGFDDSARRRMLGPALGQAWIGWQRRLDKELTDAGFADRSFPDVHVLNMCRRVPDMTAAKLGRELGITRQGAGKILAGLGERGYISFEPSPNDARQKIVVITERGAGFLAARRAAVRRIQEQVADALGPETLDSAYALLELLGDESGQRLVEYLRRWL